MPARTIGIFIQLAVLTLVPVVVFASGDNTLLDSIVAKIFVKEAIIVTPGELTIDLYPGEYENFWVDYENKSSVDQHIEVYLILESGDRIIDKDDWKDRGLIIKTDTEFTIGPRDTRRTKIFIEMRSNAPPAEYELTIEPYRVE